MPHGDKSCGSRPALMAGVVAVMSPVGSVASCAGAAPAKKNATELSAHAPKMPLAPPLPARGERSDSERSEAERWNPGDGALPRSGACGQAPSPDLRRFASPSLVSPPFPARGAWWPERQGLRILHLYDVVLPPLLVD